ncbi:MAG TPA: hypothetical protein VD908_16475, partial [Cytophagales bacterium]|nr:hypothetical protein [Cytophagales bacterium]
EDSAGLKAYRPDTFKFPPSRGRAGFKIENDSTFILYSIAPTDGWEKHYGKLELAGDNKLKIIFNQKSRPSVTYEVIIGRKDFLLVNEEKEE